ncbi:unnamed protein product [Protopolystoma xenopodis]|uniref:Translocation protein SEC62 n=1 Tax=Protopolystoma xenopodis TaxID=117903 RepID=A0A3S5BD25_9PLAT|nr:unnamed protein product [Protopolystoma xenopodis]
MLADKKKRRKTKEDPVEGNIWKPTQEEEEIARYLHRKLPSIEGKLSGVYVNVFNAEEAIDLLLNSPWARIELDIKKQKPRVFHSRVSAISFMQKLMDKRMFQK